MSSIVGAAAGADISVVQLLGDNLTVVAAVVSAAAVVVSAVLALVLIISNKENTRRTNTLNFILQIEADKDIIAARERFVDIIRSGRKSDTYLPVALDERRGKSASNKKKRKGESREERERRDRLAIDKVLNVHELTAISIEEGALDERVFRRWYNKAYIRDYESMTGYIRAIRESRGNDAIFREFEAKACEWRDDRYFYREPGRLTRKWRALRKALKA